MKKLEYRSYPGVGQGLHFVLNRKYISHSWGFTDLLDLLIYGINIWKTMNACLHVFLMDPNAECGSDGFYFSREIL